MTEIECEGDVAFRGRDHRRWNPAVKPNQKVDKFRAVRVGSAGFQLNTSVENPV